MLQWIQAEEGERWLDSLQLDIVGFLAILGEGSVLANAQVLTLSKLIFLPRLIPAPQALTTGPLSRELLPCCHSVIHRNRNIGAIFKQELCHFDVAFLGGSVEWRRDHRMRQLWPSFQEAGVQYHIDPKMTLQAMVSVRHFCMSQYRSPFRAVASQYLNDLLEKQRRERSIHWYFCLIRCTRVGSSF